MDLIKDLGELAFGSRLKRLTERMNKDISLIYRELGVEFEARWFSILYLLHCQSPLTITGVAEKLKFSHPAVNKLVTEMSKKKLLITSPDKKDKRKRLIRLSPKGQDMVVYLKPVWEDIRFVVTELIEASGYDFLAIVEGIEQLLDEKEMYERLFTRMKPRLLKEIEILDYCPAYKNKFQSLNYEWLEKKFRVEKYDEEILSDPYGKIIKDGGVILFARLAKKFIGTCALIKHDDKIYELTKMAVTAEARRRLVGTKLVLSIIDRAKEIGAPAIYLESHPSLIPAIRLYESVGFRRIKRSPVPAKYRRRRIVMKLELET